MSKNKMSKWGCDTTTKFVQEYRKYPCLWNFNSSAYKNRRMRDSAYVQLVKAMNLPNFGVGEVKNKIKNLRSTYNQELKKMEESRRIDSGGAVYESNLMWMKELEPTIVPGGKTVNKRIRYDEEDVEQEFVFELCNNEDPLPSISSIVKIENPPAPKKMKPEKSINAVNIIEPTHSYSPIKNTDSNEEDSFDAFGYSVAKQLRKLSEEKALLAQSAIQNLLTEYGIEEIRERRYSQPYGNDSENNTTT